jgi:3-deoxy-D-manno-octulosonate 8-phosphate phosphatase (KDO 8-P phosphatase)
VHEPAGLKSAELLALDVDGVLTDGALFYGPDGVTQRFSAVDGGAIVRLRGTGFPVALISFRDFPATRRRASDLGIDLLCLGTKDKAAALEGLCACLGITLPGVIFMGDSPLDLPALRLAGFSACPVDAHSAVLAECSIVTAAPGGAGAVAELVELLLTALGHG